MNDIRTILKPTCQRREDLRPSVYHLCFRRTGVHRLHLHRIYATLTWRPQWPLSWANDPAEAKRARANLYRAGDGAAKDLHSRRVTADFSPSGPPLGEFAMYQFCATQSTAKRGWWLRAPGWSGSFRTESACRSGPRTIVRPGLANWRR